MSGPARNLDPGCPVRANSLWCLGNDRRVTVRPGPYLRTMTPTDEHLAAPLEIRPARDTAHLLGLVGSANGWVPGISTDGGVTTIVSFSTSNVDVARLVDQADDR